jgi:hypothetical protein
MRYITLMISPEGEQVPLSEQVDAGSSQYGGQIEQWLSELERIMKVTVRHAILESLKCSTTCGQPSELHETLLQFKTWVEDDWIAQAILTVNQIRWTWDVEQKIRRSKQARAICDKSLQGAESDGKARLDLTTLIPTLTLALTQTLTRILTRTQTRALTLSP